MATRSNWDSWIDSARSADILSVAQSFGARLKKSGTAEFEGPCPVCSGDDRFSINVKKRVCNCRGCGLKGDVIALVEGVAGASFIEACERINQSPRPDRSRDETLQEKTDRLARRAKWQAEYQLREEEQRQIEAAKAKRDEEAIDKILAKERAVPLAGTYGEAYLRGRGLTPHKRLTGDIRFVPDLDYWGQRDDDSDEIVHLATQPAIVAVIRNSSAAIIGISQTYLDRNEPRKWTPTGSSRNSAKKIRGRKQGGMFRLGVIRECLAIGEGWENVLAWAQLGLGPANVDLGLAAAVDLGNLSGAATGTTEHPLLKDDNGKPRKIQNGIPDENAPGVIMPEGVRRIIIIADNDSEPVALHAHIRTAVKRFRDQGIEVTIHWPPPGLDFNDVLQGRSRKPEFAADEIRHPGGIETAEEFLERTDWARDPLEGLVERTAKDVSAPFAPETLRRLAALKKEDRAAFEGLRSQLKKAGCRVIALDEAIDGVEENAGVRGHKPTQADVLIDQAEAADWFHAPDGTAFADVGVNGHRETWPIRSKGFRRWLARGYFEATGSAPNSEALQSALNVIEARANFDGPERIVHVRVAGLDGKLYLDLGDKTWQAVEIDATGWRVIDNPRVRFRRASGMQPLPIPAQGGWVEKLRPFLNVQSEADFVLVVAWALAVLRNRGPYPVIALSGEQGSAKSTFSAVLRSLLDPNTAPLRALPREDRDLFIAATNSHLLAFDNVSGLHPWDFRHAVPLGHRGRFRGARVVY